MFPQKHKHPNQDPLHIAASGHALAKKRTTCSKNTCNGDHQVKAQTSVFIKDHAIKGSYTEQEFKKLLIELVGSEDYQELINP